MSDKVYFPEGFIFKQPHPNAPDFVKGQVSVKVDDFKAYLDKVNGDWLNIDLKISKEGKPYAQVNTYKPEKRKKEERIPEHGYPPPDDDLPF